MRRLLVLAALAACCASAPARAGWNGQPVQITAASPIPLVEACNDGAYGTFVAWQQAAMLRVHHLLASGDLDPAWPAAGAIACAVVADRTDLVLLPDGAGGVYLSWREGSALYVTRLDASGSTANGWPARGRSLGAAMFPVVIRDDAHGIFAAWNNGARVVMIHLDADNTEAGGWSGGAHSVRPPDAAGSIDLWPALAPDGGGGAYLAWARVSPDEQAVPSAACILRVGSDGQRVPGWPVQGVEFTPFDWTLAPDFYRRLISAAEDGRGGAFLLVAAPIEPEGPGMLQVDLRLRRLTASGDLAPGWAPEGRSAHPWVMVEFPAAAPEVLFDGLDAAIVGTPAYYSEGITEMEYRSHTDLGGGLNLGSAEPIDGRSAVVNGRGGHFLASFKPSGPYSMWEGYAKLRLIQCPAPAGWTDFSEYYTNPVINIYGDIGLAETGDGGAVLFWSQVYDRIGLFARRFGPAGETIDVPPPSAAFAIESVRFRQGAGVQVRFSIGSHESARFELFDVAGRRLATARASAARGATELTIPGTRGLSSGLYYARLTAGDRTSSKRFSILR